MSDQIIQAAGLNARERLARISHHFLSEDEQRGAADAPLFFLAAPSLDAGRHCLTPEHLAGAFARAGRSVAAFDGRGEGPSFLYPPRAPSEHPGTARHDGRIRQLLAGGRPQAPPDIVVTTRMAPIALEAGDFAVTLLAVPPDCEGMRRAFVDLKRLTAGAGPRPNVIGVTVCDALDQAQAERCFERFALAAYRFLGLTLPSYGWLPPAHGSAAAGDHAGTAHLSDIVDLLLDDWRAWNERRAAAPSGGADAQYHHFGGAHETAAKTGHADTQ